MNFTRKMRLEQCIAREKRRLNKLISFEQSLKLGERTKGIPLYEDIDNAKSYIRTLERWLKNLSQ